MPIERPLAEFVGTFALVFVGCGAIAADAAGGGSGLLGVALAFGLVVAAMVYALGHVSGAHINPAVTLGFTLVGRFPPRLALAYLAAQALGGIAAALLLRALLGDAAAAATVTRLGPGTGVAAGFVLEVVATFFLMLVIMGMATDPRAAKGLAGLAIGGAIAFDILFAGPLTGASMNPARSLGPAMAAMQPGELWLYIVAPVVGAGLAAALYEVLRPGEAHAPERLPGAYGVFGRLPRRPRG